ncbi:S41 family peptidase [Urechidicola croceus]|uniref:Peptidase S41 n=1 Tax=Urechidicola croceus TaxID=1850246 RepID=A0A1D8P9D3_9FLAO|nr:S41 family peptidase [Urechidicola croceus]AOW21153.1 peptidase S41 [Urechidicola croceus]
MKNMKKKITGVLLVFAISISWSYKSDFFEIAKQIEIYTTLFKELNLYYVDEINPADIMDKTIQNTLSELDPYTRFYDEQGVENAKISAEGEYGGIGATTTYRNKNLIVREVYKDYPANKAGIIPGDIIVKIDNTILENQSEDIVRSLLKGLPSSTVSIQVKRQNQLLDFNITRETVEINPVPFYEMVDDEVGYISFIKFNKKAAKEVRNAFLDLKSQGMSKLIIDVRKNPGGLLNEAVDIVNFFIPKNKVVVTTKAKLDKWSNTYKTKNEPLDTEIPITILIDGRSASASEILAGALQDYDRAVIVGERSFGKGLVQRSRKLSYGTQLKLTISKYYTPSGRCIQELDYANREGDDIPKFSDLGVSEFKTENGRKVFDGGGVAPDLEIKKPEKTEATIALLSSDEFFNFVTSYYFKNPSVAEPNNFQLGENEFSLLKTYITNNSENFKLKTEYSLEKALESAKNENLNINTEYLQLLRKIKEEKISSLDLNKDEIIEELTSEIINRYYFKEGEYQQKLVFDTLIKESLSVLKNENRYKEILQ